MDSDYEYCNCGHQKMFHRDRRIHCNLSVKTALRCELRANAVYDKKFEILKDTPKTGALFHPAIYSSGK